MRPTLDESLFGTGAQGDLSLSADTLLPAGQKVFSYRNVSLNGFTLTVNDIADQLLVSGVLDFGNGGVISATGKGTPSIGGGAASNGGGAGGSGGRGGGGLWVFARRVRGTGFVQSDGTAGLVGGNGGNVGVSTNGAAGGSGRVALMWDIAVNNLGASSGAAGGGLGGSSNNGGGNGGLSTGGGRTDVFHDVFAMLAGGGTARSGVWARSWHGAGGAGGGAGAASAVATGTGAGGGGGGAGGGFTNKTVNNSTSEGGKGGNATGTGNTGGAGGGGGGSAGLVVFACGGFEAASSVTLQARGGAGGAGGNGSNGGGGGGGGGGGEGGIVIAHVPKGAPVTRDVSGGAGGAGGTGGGSTAPEAGLDGADGHDILLETVAARMADAGAW